MIEKPQISGSEISDCLISSTDYAQVFESMGIPVMVVGNDLETILQSNSKARSIFGKTTLLSELDQKIRAHQKGGFGSVAKSALKAGKEKSLLFAFAQKDWRANFYPTKSGVSISFEQIKKSKAVEKVALYKAIFDSMEEQFLLSDHNFNIIDVNESFARRSGYSKAELQKLKTFKLGSFVTLEEAKEMRRQALEKPLSFEINHKNKEGFISNYGVNYFHVKLNENKYFGVLSRDITAFKKVQQQLLKSNQRFELITNSTMEGLWKLDVETGECWSNKTYQNYYGRDHKEPVPHNEEWRERIHPSVRAEIASGFQRAINQKKKNWSAEYWFKTFKGDYIFVFDRALMIYNENGDLIKMMGSMIDVTELKKTQEEFHSQKNLSDGIINSLPGIFFLLNKDRKLIRWNKNFEKLMGYTSKEIGAMNPAGFFSPAEKDGVRIKILEVFQKGKAEMEVNLVNKKGKSSLFYVTGWRALIGNEECLIGTGIDMTEIKKAQERIKQMEEKITSQKIQEQKTISRAIINAQEKERNYIGRELHDNVNQLLAGARLYLSMGLKNNPDLKEIVKYPLELLDNGIKEIRNLTHHNITPPKEIELNSLINGIAELLSAGSIQCKIEFELTRTLNENLLVNVYRILQEQANNIIKHSQAQNVSISLKEKGSNLWIQTNDDGIGFDVHQLREGIGLYNIYSRVDAYNGEVEIESAPGKGCRIDIKIPAFEVPFHNQEQTEERVNGTALT